MSAYQDTKECTEHTYDKKLNQLDVNISHIAFARCFGELKKYSITCY